MKKKAILSALFSAFVACFFVACSNDSDALDINAGTRSVTSSYMTREEVQARLDEIGDRYGETIILVPETDITKVTEEFFTWVESVYKIDNTTIEDGATVVDDEQIDEIAISKIGTYAAPGENVCYTGSFTANCQLGSKTIPVKITWSSNSNKPDSVSATCEYYEITNIKHSIFSGPVYNPTFEYSFYLNGIKFVGVYLGGGMAGTII